MGATSTYWETTTVVKESIPMPVTMRIHKLTGAPGVLKVVIESEKY